MKRRGSIHIGTSGWHYTTWKGPFYPEHLQVKEFLNYYAHQFHTVEINNSFYQLPQKDTLRHWRDSVPENFIFSVKASRYITHMKKLKDPLNALDTFLKTICVLGNKLGPILFQLPPHWKCNPERLISFLKVLDRRYRYAFEFRDPSWFNRGVYEALTDYNAAFCMYDLGGRLSPKKITADFAYIRLHGPRSAYLGSYSTETLEGWASAFSVWSGQGRQIYCYFDNDEAGYAAQDALRLQGMIHNKQ